MAVTKNQRALVVLKYIATGDSDIEWLYGFAEGASGVVVDAGLGDQYGTIVRLKGTQATRPKLLSTLADLGNRSDIKAIDLLVMVHGEAERLLLRGGKHAMDRLAFDIDVLGIGKKLRLAYSTACYGATHADELVAAGFDCAVGAKQINANGATEFPLVVAGWSSGKTIETAVADGAVGMDLQDAAAVVMGFNGVDSTKVIAGDGDLTISSNASLRGRVYAFRGSQYVRYDRRADAVDAGYPKPIASNWHPFLANGVDAAVNGAQGKAYFFKGNRYLRWDLDQDRADTGYPKPIGPNWHPLLADGVDAAIGWPNGKIYLFKGNQYVRWTPEPKGMDAGYPKLIGPNWHPFLADGVDAAVNWGDGKAYFFRGDRYLRWDLASNTADAGFPKPIAGRFDAFLANGVDAILPWLG